jgi:ABC-type nitrate/sulfonate/bicarbonate transport system substrate-binding protein
MNPTPSGRRGIRHQAVIVALAVLALALAACSSSSGGQQAAGTTKIRLIYDFASIDFEAVPFVVGNNQGFYKKHGLSVQVILPPDTSSTVKVITRGDGDIGFSSTADEAFAVASGIPVKSIANYSAQNNWGLFTKPGTGVDISNIKGKSFGVFTDAWTKAMMPYILKAGNVSATDIKQIILPNGDMAAMLAGKIDIATNTTNYAIASVESNLGKQPGVALGTKYGAPNIPIWIYIATNSWLQSHPTQAKEFLAATEEATEWAIANPVQAAKEFDAAYPNNGESAQYNLMGWKATIPFLKNSAGQLFTQSDSEWSEVANALKSTNQISTAYPASQYYTNEYLPN